MMGATYRTDEASTPESIGESLLIVRGNDDYAL